MIFFYEFISIKVTEENVNTIIVFLANFNILKNESNMIEKLRSDWSCNLHA